MQHQTEYQSTSTSPTSSSPQLGSASAATAPRVSDTKATLQPLGWGESVPGEHGGLQEETADHDQSCKRMRSLLYLDFPAKLSKW